MVYEIATTEPQRKANYVVDGTDTLPKNQEMRLQCYKEKNQWDQEWIRIVINNVSPFC